MNELHHDKNSDRQMGWLRAIGIGVAVSLLTATLLSVALGYFFPEVMDDPSSKADANRLGIAIWVISIGLGAWQAAKRRPR